MNQILYVFVENFSTTKREEFFEKELPYLSNAFEKVIVIPLYKENTELNFTNNKIEIKQFDAFSSCNRLKIVAANFFLILKIFIKEVRLSHNSSYYFKNFSKVINVLILRIASADNLMKEIGSNINNAVFYTYWFNQWTMILSIAKYKSNKLKLITRAHGSDYKEEQTNTTLLFRYFQLQQVNAIAPVSQYAKNYLTEKFKVNKEKIYVNRLGLEHGEKLSPIDNTVLHIVSCSSLIPLKRVHLITEILSHISVAVKWDHFGDGGQMEQLKKHCLTLAKNVEVNLHGYVPNEDFKKYLINEPVSFFINVSSYEGIPVTLMEASSLGIPLIGCDTGGVSEIVTNETGYLIPVNFNAKEIAGLIETQHKKADIYTLSYRQKVQAFYNQHFSATENHQKFSNFLLNLN